jgi:hypothetical protein
MKIITKQPDYFTTLAYVYGVDNSIVLNLNYEYQYVECNLTLSELLNVSVPRRDYSKSVATLNYFTYRYLFICDTVYIFRDDIYYKTVPITAEFKKIFKHIELPFFEFGNNLGLFPGNFGIKAYTRLTTYTGLTDFISYEDIYTKVYNYLLRQKIDVEVSLPEIPNDCKVTQHGFNLKTSFRNRKS